MKALALMSGGRDSLLAACMMIEEGFDLVPFFCDNGHIQGVDRIYDTVGMIDERYGTMFEQETVIASTAMTAHRYMQSHWYLTPEQLAQSYPGAQGYQLNCLACRTSMYTHAIAYCKANQITDICDGVRRSQGFFVDNTMYIEQICRLCDDHGIKFHTPVVEIWDDFDRKRKLCDRGMPTKTFETQCFLGSELKNVPVGQETSLMNFFDKELRPLLSVDIDNLIPVYRQLH